MEKKSKSAIVNELLRKGLVRGTRAFRLAYQEAYRGLPGQREYMIEQKRAYRDKKKLCAEWREKQRERNRNYKADAENLSVEYGDEFTKCELDVAEKIVVAMTNEQIAVDLTLTIQTIKYHVTKIYVKAGVETRSQFIVAYYQRTLLAQHLKQLPKPQILGGLQKTTRAERKDPPRQNATVVEVKVDPNAIPNLPMGRVS